VAKRSRTLAELARVLGVDEPTAEQALEELEADLALPLSNESSGYLQTRLKRRSG
jgi:DNA-directed RNA polymerase subunit K/omega